VRVIATIVSRSFLIMCLTEDTSMSSDVLSDLENKIDQLVELSERLQKENAGLRQRESSLLKEKGQLMEKTEQARSRVESMITRLKALNHEG